MSHPPPPDDFDEFLDSLFTSSAGGPLSEIDRARLGSATGRASVSAENIVANIQRLEGLAETVNPAQRARLTRLIDGLKKQLPGDWTRAVTEDRGAINNASRGIASGIVTAGTGMADLLLTPIDMLPDAMGGAAAGRARSALQENMAVNREIIDPQGKAGLAGELTGGIAAGAPGYGAAARGSASLLAKVAPGLRPILAGTVAGGPVKRRLASAAGNVLAGLPINVVQAAGAEDGSDGAKAAAIGIGADALFGALMPGSQLPQAPRGRAAASLNKDEMLAREVEIANLGAKAEADAKVRRDARAVRGEAVEAWKRANPNEKWSDLTREQKEAIHAAYRASRPTPEAPPPVDGASSTPMATPEQVQIVRNELARAERVLVDEPNNAEAIEQRDTYASMLERIAPNEAPRTTGQATPLHPKVELLKRRQQITQALRLAGIEHNPNDTIEQLSKVLQEANERPTTFQGISAKIARLQSESLNLRNQEDGDITPEITERLNAIRDEIADLMTRKRAAQSGVVTPPPEPTGSVVGQRGANAVVSGAVETPKAAAIDPLEERLAALKRGERTAPRVQESTENIAAGKFEQIQEYIEGRVASMANSEFTKGDSPEKWHKYFLGETPILRAIRRVLDEHRATINELTELVGGSDDVLKRLPERWQRMYTLAQKYEKALKDFKSRGPDRYGYSDVFGDVPKFKHDMELENIIWGKSNVEINEPKSDFQAFPETGTRTKQPKKKRPPKAQREQIEMIMNQLDDSQKAIIVERQRAILADPNTTPEKRLLAEYTIEQSGLAPSPITDPSAPAPNSAPSPTDPPAVDSPPSVARATKPFTERIRKLSDDQLDKLEDKLGDALEAIEDITSLQYKGLSQQLSELMSERAIRNATKEVVESTGIKPEPEVVPEAAPKKPRKPKTLLNEAEDGIAQEMNLPPELRAPKEGIPSAVLNKSPRSMNDAELDQVIAHYDARLNAETDVGAVEFLRTKMTRAIDERARRALPPKGPNGEGPTPDEAGLKARSPYTLGAFLGGYAVSYYNSDPNDPDRMSKAFMWGLGSAGAFRGVNYLRNRQIVMRKPKRSDMLPNRDDYPNKVVDVEELNAQREPTSFLERSRQFYTGTVRGTFGLDRFNEAIGRQNAPAEINVAKLGAMMGRYIARVERFLTSNGRLTYEEDGEVVVITNDVMAKHGLPVDPETGDAPRGLSFILGMADGDKDALGQLAVAYASMEGAGRGAVPMPREQAEVLIRGAHPQLRLAVKELRKYNIGLMFTAYKAGRLSLEGLQSMAREDWYTPFHRVSKQLEKLQQRVGKNNIRQPDPIAGRKGGSKLSVINPYDIAVEQTRRVLRANEYGQILNSFVGQVKNLPQAIRSSILEPVSSNMNPKVSQIEDAVTQLRRVANMTESDARSMLAYIEGDSVFYGQAQGYKDTLMHVFENGALQTYRLKRPDIFEALKSLTPSELDMAYRLIGMPARVASKGVVYNPVFIARMAFIDSFQAWLGSKYGFRPGIDQMRGFFHSLMRSEKYQRLLDIGGPATIQSLSYIDPGSATDAAKLAGERAIDTAINNLKSLKVVEAYKAIALPVAESARVGEYLRALDHGASTLEAAYAAWDVVGNPRMQGSFASIRAFHQMTMFSKPALSAMDKLVKEMGIGPVAPEYNKTQTGRVLQNLEVAPRVAAAMTFMTKGVVGITLPSLLLWYANKDDEEIRKLRQTKTGQMYWFVRDRTTQEIYKVRKPHIIGQFFGSAAEAFADNQMQEDPENLLRALSSMFDDASVNTLPQLGVITYGLWANKSPGLGSPITPSREEALAPEMRGYDRASLPARIVADRLKDISGAIDSPTLRRAMSPAGIDYIVRNTTGMLGEDALQIVTSAVDYAQSGYLPSKDEAPMMSRFLARYPSMNVEPIREFYRRDLKVEEVARSVDWLQRNNPALLGDYFLENQNYIVLIDAHKEARQNIANFRRAIDDLSRMPRSIGSRETQRRVELQFIKMIEQETSKINSVYKAMSR